MAFELIARLIATLAGGSTSASNGLLPTPSSTSQTYTTSTDDIPLSTGTTLSPTSYSSSSSTTSVSSNGSGSPIKQTMATIFSSLNSSPSSSVSQGGYTPDSGISPVASPTESHQIAMTTSSSTFNSSSSSSMSQGAYTPDPGISPVASPTESHQIAMTTSSSTFNSSSSSSMSQGAYTPDPGISPVASPAKSQLADGAVAGAIIGVAVGIALVTFLVTFFFMRRKRIATERGQSVLGSASDGPGHQADEKPNKAHMTLSNTDTLEYERYFPPSADDKAIEQRTKNTLDQIELHIENYYQNISSTHTRPNDRELASFNSPYLPKSLASMLSHSRDGTLLIKHVLTYLVISSISPSAKPGSSLLPAEFVGLPTSAASTEFGPASKPGKTHVVHWISFGV